MIIRPFATAGTVLIYTFPAIIQLEVHKRAVALVDLS